MLAVRTQLATCAGSDGEPVHKVNRQPVRKEERKKLAARMLAHS
jgi:hypothetical protein